jgi:hypothetical protein
MFNKKTNSEIEALTKRIEALERRQRYLDIKIDKLENILSDHTEVLLILMEKMIYAHPDKFQPHELEILDTIKINLISD